MSHSLKRLLAVGIAAAVAFVGFAPAAPAEAVTASHRSRASHWLATNEPTDTYSNKVISALGLAVLDRAADAAELRERMADLAAGAAANVPGHPGDAAKLAILVRIMHLNATNFGGTDLIQAIRDASHLDSTDPAVVGQVGGFASAYGQALAIIAIKRAHQPVPPAIVTRMMALRDSSGAFGYFVPDFIADPDSTALAIQALYLIGHHKTALGKAVAWARSQRLSDGHWESYSQINSTALLASSLKLVGKGYKKAKAWLFRQQLADGGFPATLGGTDSDLYATHEATFLLAGTTYAKGSYHLKGYTASPRPTITGTAQVTQILTVDPGTWAPVPQLSIQWLRSGKPIAGETGPSYTLTTADLGKRIRVKVTAKGMGLKTAVRYSIRTKYVGA